MQRREILLQLGQFLSEDDIVLAALAGTTKDCYQVMHRRGNLYALGMGLVSPVAFGLSLALPRRRIIALDTDGGLLLSPSILSVVGASKPPNLHILVFDNEHLLGSAGGPPSQTANGTDLARVASGAGIAKCDTLDRSTGIESKLRWFLEAGGPAVLVAKVEATFPPGEGPTMNGQENKFQIVRFIEQIEKIEILGSAK